MPILDLSIFLLYMVAIVGFGLSFSFRKRSSSDYTTGGGRLPAWAIGMSIFATFVSSISFLAYPGNAYSTNWNGLVFSLSIPLAGWVAVKYFVPLYRRLNSESAYFYLEQRFGSWARIYASICYLLTQLARMGAILYLLALPMNSLVGVSIPMIIIITGLSVVVYSMWGGIEAVIWTDAVQGIILIGGALACILVIFVEIPGGAAEVFRIAGEADKFSLGSFELDFTTSTFWMVLVYGLFINLQNFGIDQSYVQRYLTAKTEKEAKKSTWLGSLLFVPVSLLFFFIGSALFAFYQAQPDLLFRLRLQEREQVGDLSLVELVEQLLRHDGDQRRELLLDVVLLQRHLGAVLLEHGDGVALRRGQPPDLLALRGDDERRAVLVAGLVHDGAINERGLVEQRCRQRMKTRRHYADDRVRSQVQENCFTDGIRITVQLFLPQLVAQHCNLIFPLLLLLR